MTANATTSLFNVTPNNEKHNEIKIQTNPIEATLAVMEECLEQAITVTTLIITTSYTPISRTRGLKQLAKKHETFIYR